MPEKRRKNNKNKRKNKNNRSEVSNVSKDAKQINDNDANSNQSEPNCDKNVIVQLPTEKNVDVEVVLPSHSIPSEAQNVTDTSSGNTQILNESNNGNESEIKTQLLNVDDLKSDEILETDVSISTTYVVESPDQVVKNKPKLSSVKSKSLDSDDIPKIIELTEEAAKQCEEENSLSIINSSDVLIADVESDIEWEKTDDMHDSEQNPTKNAVTGTLSITTIPLDIAQCEQAKSLTPQEEISLRNYLKTLDLSTSPENMNSIEIKTEIEQIINREIKHRLRKKGITDDFLIPRTGHARMLDVIDEEGSGESSLNSRRHSYLSDKKSDTESIDDDVFEDKNALKHKFSTKAIGSLRDVTFGRLVPQQCILVGAKLKEPEVCEARGDWTMTTVEKMTGAEVVYLTDSSSSTSSIHEIGNDNDDGIESDVSIRMITPTIEVTDTENLLKNTFISKSETSKADSELMKPQGSENNEHIVEIEFEKDKDNSNADKDSIQSTHEIVVLSTENIKTNLYVKDIDDNCNTNEKQCIEETNKNSSSIENNNKELSTNNKNEFDLEIKVIKCELNDAINNLIKEVTSDSEPVNDSLKDNFTRQDSSSSICSSQCTAKYNPTYSSLNDVSNLQHDEVSENMSQDTEQNVMQERKQFSNVSHVKDVFESVTGMTIHNENKYNISSEQPLTLKNICLKRVASFPFGDKILEELASVSEKLQKISVQASESNRKDKNIENNSFKSPVDVMPTEESALLTKKSAPPPITPRRSSLKMSHEDDRTSGYNKSQNTHICLSPSQKMLMEKTNTILSNDESDERNYKHRRISINNNCQVDHSENRSKEDEYFNNPPSLPFKSQTGSRLLALICDPSITASVNSLRKLCDENIEQHEKKTMISVYKPMINKDRERTRDFSNLFKPIPPPRKISSSVYESDESSDFTDNSLRSIKREKKVFHFSTGNLNKEIENDISSIQNRHRFYADIQEQSRDNNVPRRPSLPKDLCDQQMEYIRQKEKEVEAEIKRLQEKQNHFANIPRRGPRAPLISEKEVINEQIKDANNYSISRQKNVVIKSSVPEKRVKENSKISSLFSSSQEELQREKMYSEYVSRMAEREERKQHKIIKVTNTSSQPTNISKSMSALDAFDTKINNRIEEEFISKARQRWEKLGIRDPETEDESDRGKNVYKEPTVIEHKIKVIEGGEEKDVKKLPSHLQEFVRFTTKDKEISSSAVWRPNAPTPPPAPAPPAPTSRSPGGPPPPPPPPVWVPGSVGASPQASRKTYRPVHFEETPPTRRKFGNTEQNGCTSGSESEGRLRTSQSAPATGLSNLTSSLSSRLPRAQNPTVTLLQKAREGQIPRGSSYLQTEKDSARLPRDRPSPPKGDLVHALRKEYASESEAESRDWARRDNMADTHNHIQGIGPITKDGMPVALRSEVKDPSRWYKKMYDTIHKNKYDDDYVTIRYKSRRGEPAERVVLDKSQYLYLEPRSGYMSEPEGAGAAGGAGGVRRRTASVQDHVRASPGPAHAPPNKYSTLASARASQEVYKSQPGKIEDYVPGRSSVVDKEAKQWWDEVMDIFDGWLDDNSPLPPYTTLLARAIQKSQNISSTTSLPQASPKEKKDITSTILSKSNMAKALKESGYESDSTLVFRRREDTEAPLSPAERRAAYRDLQAGGEPPIRGFRSPAPPRQDETEIEYIPISPTLTKIRIHKKTPKLHEVICYPLTSIEPDVIANLKRSSSTFFNPERGNYKIDYPPAPPRRISSKNSRTLKLVTSVTPQSSDTSKKITTSQSHSNVDFLKDKISHKLTRQNTHIITKPSGRTDVKLSDQNLSKARIMSISAPPAVYRKNSSESSRKSDIKISGTSSFGSPRRTLLPIEYPHYTHSRCGEPSTSVVIEGGAGRRTPITNILDKVTSLDKLWSADKRNERIDVAKANKSVARSNIIVNKPKSTIPLVIKPVTTTSTHKSRDMIRTAEKVQKIKNSNQSPKQNTCLVSRNEQRVPKSRPLQLSSNISKSSSNITSCLKKQTQIKSAVVTNLKKKKSMESVVIRPRSVPCHESCSKKNKDFNKQVKKTTKSKPVRKSTMIDSESGSQFGDTSNEASNFGSYENVCNKQKIAKEITKSHEAITTDSFFQHLFLGRPCSSIVTYPVFEQNTTVLQKAKMFQSLPSDNNTPKSLNSYLIHRKPVSLSRFKMWDRYPSPKRPQSPRSISWPGRIHTEIRKFDSLSKTDDFGSTSSLATIRSRSEPPINKLYFSQTSRPKSPVVIFYKKDNVEDMSHRNSTSPARLFFSQTSRPVSPKVVNKTLTSLPRAKEQSPSPTRIVFTETSRPISPVITRRSPSADYYKEPPSNILTSKPNKTYSNNVSRSHSTSPVTVRSPSYRRIYNARLQSGKVYTDSTKNVLRTRSAGDADKRIIENKTPLKIKSDSNIHANDPEYDEYIKDIQNIKTRSERFRELNRYYTYLERVAELEKATSTIDLRHRKKDEDIIDFDRWKKIRAIERAEEELNNLYRKLKIAQSEKDVLFYPRDIKDFRWNFDRERGLRIKEKSVEDLKDHFQQMSYYEGVDFDQTSSKDVYKPLWRGTSVAETAFHINRKNEKGKDEPKIIVKPTVALQQDATLSDLRKKIGLGSRLWSSLSMEQVNALKNQLNAIYSKELESKSSKESEHFIMNVSDSKIIETPNLHVRCNSLISTREIPDQNKPKTLVKSESIAAMPCPITSVKELKNNVNKIQMSLSENEKRKLSQTLSKELLDRMNKYDSPPVSLKQEIENTQIKEKLANEMKNTPTLQTKAKSIESTISKPSAEIARGDEKKYGVYANDKSETQYQSSASETETASSDVSNKTVIYCGPSKEVKKKVEYFESVRNILNPPNIIYHARENSDENVKQNTKNHEELSSKRSETESQKGQIVQSQSCTDIKALFGESEKNKFLSLPAKPELHSRSVSPHSEVYISDRQTPDTQRFSSDETIWRSRSPSPDPERYWRAYLKLARAGEVRRLVRRFDSPPTSGALLRRHRSDPELARNVLNKNWSSFEKLSSRRDKCRAMLPVARVPLRSTNRFMPHIDIISKLAALRRRTAPRSRSAEEALECRPGEVDRIRRRFEAMSLLGQIYASAPDVRELHDIAHYLAGSWIAHRYPKPSDNNRSVKDPSVLVQGRSSPVKKDIKGSLSKESVKLSSILKSESLATQEFDPTLHRPASRYEPPRTPPRPPPAAWPQRLSPYVTSSKHTVKFQEADTAPEPPRRSQLGSYSDTESPRRYVESDVNIHYRCPVRHDPLPLVPERELARQQAEHMKRLYREQRRNKYLQELQDMQNRRHQDNFTPSQKTVVPLNRYDEADKVIAKALYTFNGQTARELSFRKGDIIHVRRQIDSNWYEGEVHGKIGLFPYNYVELQKGDIVQTPKKPAVVEGRARAKFDFTAQTNLELPLKKGEVVVLTRRIDQNWWEGRNGVKTGIFPDSYVTVLQEPSPSKPELKPILSTEKPMASPAAHGLLNGSDKRSMGAHHYTPQQNSAALANAPPASQPLPGYLAKPAQAMTPSERGYGPPTGAGVDLNNTQPLYVDTNAEAVPYRAMYKYRPQNPDELELCEGDTVYVLEKCDDGWYVGSSQRTGRFGTFPGNYVERI